MSLWLWMPRSGVGDERTLGKKLHSDNVSGGHSDEDKRHLDNLVVVRLSGVAESTSV